MSYNLKTELEAAEAEAGELVFAIVVGRHGDAHYHTSPAANENVVLSREDGMALLNQAYDNGFGGADCRPFYAYSQNRIYFVSEYDGATRLTWMPRHPVDCKPSFQ